MAIFDSERNCLNYVVDLSGLVTETEPRMSRVRGLSAVMGWDRYICTHLEQDHNTTIEKKALRGSDQLEFPQMYRGAWVKIQRAAENALFFGAYPS